MITFINNFEMILKQKEPCLNFFFSYLDFFQKESTPPHQKKNPLK